MIRSIFEDIEIEFAVLRDAPIEQRQAETPREVELEIEEPGRYGIYCDHDASVSFEVRSYGFQAPTVYYPATWEEDAPLATFVAEGAGTYALAAHRNDRSRRRLRLVVGRVPASGDALRAQLARMNELPPLLAFARFLIAAGGVVALATFVMRVSAKSRPQPEAAP